MKIKVVIFGCLLSTSIFAIDPISKYGHTLKCGSSCHEAITKLVIETKADGHYKCSGALISPNQVLTNKHCVPSNMRLSQSCKDEVSFLFATKNGESQKYECDKLVSTNESTPGDVNSLDYAIFSLKKKTGRKPLKLSKGTVEDKDSLWIVKVDNQVKSFVNREKCTVKFNSLAFPFSGSGDSKVLTFTGCNTEPGNSGSPLLNSKGEIAAILEGRNTKSNKVFFKKFFGVDSTGVQKATNIKCVFPKGRFIRICRETKKSSDFLLDGNKLLEKRAFEDYKLEETDTALGLRFMTEILFSSHFQQNRLRPDTFFSGPSLKCVVNKDKIILAARKLSLKENKEFRHMITIGKNKICPIEFSFSQSMHIRDVSSKKCKVLETLMFLNFLEDKIDYHVAAIGDDSKVEAWRRGSISACK